MDIETQAFNALLDAATEAKGATFGKINRGSRVCAIGLHYDHNGAVAKSISEKLMIENFGEAELKAILDTESYREILCGTLTFRYSGDEMRVRDLLQRIIVLPHRRDN